MGRTYANLYGGDYYWEYVSYGIPLQGINNSLLMAISQAAAELTLTVNFDADDYKGQYYFVTEQGQNMAWTFKSVQKKPDNWYINGTRMNCLVIDGTLVYGYLPTITKGTWEYDDGSIFLRFTVSNPWNVSGKSYNVYCERGDSTPDILIDTISTTRTTEYEIEFDPSEVAAMGSGTHTFYIRIGYLGTSYTSNVIYGNVTVPAATKTWVLIEETSSQPSSYDVYIEDSSVPGSYPATGRLEFLYPAANQSEGDIGVVLGDFWGDPMYYVCEVQT